MERTKIMARFLAGTRYLILFPIFGLALAAGVFFVAGGYGLVRFIIVSILEALHIIAEEAHAEDIPAVIEVIEFVHTFLIGTVLYITAVGLYQLFIEEVEFHGWLKIDSTEELEMNLIGVTVVVLAVNFLGVAFTGDPSILLDYGAGVALPIAALALFVGLRVWSTHLTRSDSETASENPYKSEDSEE
jgi:uncharacterized membrane protein YqhA